MESTMLTTTQVEPFGAQTENDLAMVENQRRSEVPSRRRRRRVAVAAISGMLVFQSAAQMGLQVVMVIYLRDHVGMVEWRASLIASLFIVAYSLTGVVGAYVADSILGSYRLQRIAASTWVIGAVLMAISAFNAAAPWALWRYLFSSLSMALIAIGYGAINPVQSVFLADQFDAVETAELEASFSMFYAWCNVGALVGDVGAPILRAYVSLQAAMLALLGCAVLGWLALLAGSRYYVKLEPERKPRRLVQQSMQQPLWEKLLSLWKQAREMAIVLRPVVLCFWSLPIFYTALFAIYSVWVYQSEDMDRHVGSFEIPADAMFAFEDICCILGAVVIEYLVAPGYQRVFGVPFRSIPRMKFGLCCGVLAYVGSALVQREIDAKGKGVVPVYWQLPQYMAIAIGEVFIGVSGLEFAYARSPPALRNQVTAMWSIVQAVGSLIAAGLFGNPASASAMYIAYFVMAGLCFVTLVAFSISVRNIPAVAPNVLLRVGDYGSSTTDEDDDVGEFVPMDEPDGRDCSSVLVARSTRSLRANAPANAAEATPLLGSG
ncbi:TGF-beta receptor type I/II extracellular region [Thecamonas trahens ATCC 50062]|uniref:TGF-beta receptor type I/II extracellular region n=1 Tax=Thecamonas trahens ATCC 50062 TaxID=461836 RepID=A0A0L0D3V8_THETB|nr:TGF-beta receptor type I/II extracellular region [Thecamonas trahens ATCC 50062]KNC47004.1 TGF-beta receptor type I/II extracellular region [Thecamonas trahens ATCC 50062]|eukprot:XP_013759787.1 TGF-beta receptor type I/II extracellular region [Thecamonas trahens ATCC 50062]